jgi:carboxypeptidase Q
MRNARFSALFGLALLACDQGAPAPAPSASASAVSSAAAKPSGAKTPPPEAIDAARDGARRLTGEILVAGQATKTLTELTDFAGPRLTGSDVHARAAGWAAERFRSYGVDATLEPFTLDHTWVRGEARAKMVAPREQVLRVAAIGWTPGTPAEGVRGEVVKVDDLSPDAVAKRTDLKGKIAFYDAAAGRKAGWTAHPPYRLAQAGAAAVVIHWARPFNALFGTACKGPKEAACSVPVFVMGSEDGAVVARLADAGPVTLDLASTASVGGPAQVPNVVAEIRGGEAADEMVVVGAHLDSWDLATGAQDNGSGSAQVLEAARAIRALGTPPRRTIRFVLWAGEEEGLLGSRAYVKAHAAELDRVVAYLNTDLGAGAPVGWDADGRDDLVDAMKPVAKSLLAGLGADVVHAKIRCDTDHCPFWLEGIPTLNLDVDASAYEDIHHLASDTVDKVKDHPLADGAAAVAVTAWAIAQLPERIAPRIGHAAIGKHLKGADVLPMLIESGMWKP